MIKIDKIKKFRRINRAFTLVETLVAIAIFTTSILGLMSILASGISNTNYAKNKITASYLAQEGIEYVRNMRDTYGLYTMATGRDWNGFKAKLTPCNSGNECGFNSSFPLTDPSFLFKCSSDPIDCKLYLNNGSYNDDSTGGIYSGFTRKIWMDPINSDEVKISSVVSWTQGFGNYNVTFSENLFNWIE